jgi:RNA polymerase sigma-70 factor, ECF subfamily
MPSDDFEELWVHHFTAVARTAFLVSGDREAAMDDAQEAFARAFQHWGKVSKLERPEGWVHKVATNLAVSRSRRRRLPHTPVGSNPGPEPPDDALFAAISSLTPAQRAVVALRFYLDWSIDDVALALGKRPGTVTALTHQAMVRLRAQLSKEPHDG